MKVVKQGCDDWHLRACIEYFYTKWSWNRKTIKKKKKQKQDVTSTEKTTSIKTFFSHKAKVLKKFNRHELEPSPKKYLKFVGIIVFLQYMKTGRISLHTSVAAVKTSAPCLWNHIIFSIANLHWNAQRMISTLTRYNLFLKNHENSTHYSLQ